MTSNAALPPWLLKAVEDAGDATVILRAGERPYVIKSKAPYHLGTQPLTKLVIEGLAQQILSEDGQQALSSSNTVEETVNGAHIPVIVQAVRLDHDIVIRLRHAHSSLVDVSSEANVNSADNITLAIEDETRDIKAREAEPAAAPLLPIIEQTVAPARARFVVENAGGEAIVQTAGGGVVGEIELPVEESAVETFIAALSPVAVASAAPQTNAPAAAAAGAAPLVDDTITAATREQEEAARRALGDATRQAQKEAASRESEEAARRELEEAARRAREDAEAARRQLEEVARRALDDATRRAQEEAARRESEEAARRELEETARRAQEEAEAARRALDDATRRAQEEAARRESEEVARHELEEAARRAREEAEAARRELEEAARRELEEAARRARDDAEAARRELEQAARRAQDEAEAARRELEDATRRAQEEAARRVSEAAARHELEETARRAQEEAEAARRELEDATRRLQEEAARRVSEAAARHELEETARRAQDEADAARRELEDTARRERDDGPYSQIDMDEKCGIATRAEYTAARATVVEMSRRRPLAVATTELTDWILEAMDQGATTLYLRPGKPPAARIDGHVETLAVAPLPVSMFERAGTVMTSGEDGWSPAGEWAWSKDIPGTGSVHCQAFSDGRGGGFIVQLPVLVAGLEQQVPAQIRNACETGEGLVVVSAPFAKDVAAMVGAVVSWSAQRRAGHIIAFGTNGSLERSAGNAFISDRPLPVQDHEMMAALQGAMREQPDMLVISANGSLPAAEAVVSAAVGRLVLVGVVARTAPRALEILLKGMGSNRRALAAAFKAGCSWRWLRRADGRRIVIADSLVATDQVSALIEAGDVGGLHVAQDNHDAGMRALDAALAAAVTRRKITLREAAACAVDRRVLISLVRRQTRNGRAAEPMQQVAGQRAPVRGMTGS